tara:strand:- start:2172 stop:2894 length:723 start_codon:yes stop_codon:yes gene_type:complete
MYKIKGSDIEHEIKSMLKYDVKKQEMDKLLESLVLTYLENKKLEILDACCGIGHVSRILSDLSPQSKFIGVDSESELIKVGKKLNKSQNISLINEDIFKFLANNLKQFDISVCWKTLSWFSYYEDLLIALIKSTKNHIFISSLFFDGDIDFEIRVREFKKEAGHQGFNKNYNVYSLPQFKRFALSRGVKNIDVVDFDITIDLPRPPIDEMGTHTITEKNGHKTQVSGAVVQYWKIIRLDL